MKKKIIGKPEEINKNNINLINKTKINNFYLHHNQNFRNRIIKDISRSDDILDIGKSMRGFFSEINCNSLTTLDVNEFQDYPDIIFDLCDNLPANMENKYDKIICLAVLEHVYNPFKAVDNIKKMLKKNSILYGYVPYLYKYHAPENLKFQDYFRFSKDALAYLFKEFNEIEIFPIRGRISAPVNILIPNKIKKIFEKLNLNILLDKISSDKINSIQCSGYNFIIKN